MQGWPLQQRDVAPGWLDHRVGNTRHVRGNPERVKRFGAAWLYCRATEPKFQPKDNMWPWRFFCGIVAKYSRKFIWLSCRRRMDWWRMSLCLNVITGHFSLGGIWYLYLNQNAAAAAAKSLQLCPSLCNPIDGSPRGSPVPGILQARTLEWVAISFSNAWKWKVKVKLLSRVRPSATPWTAAYQASLPTGFSRQEYWSGVPLPSPWTKIGVT